MTTGPPIIRIDADLALPINEQIRQQVARMIAAGTLAEGARLPTIRQLANDLGLAKGTVTKAYALLEADGLVESSGRRGTRVIGVPTSPRSAEAVDEVVLGFTTACKQLGLDLQMAVDAVHRGWATDSAS